MSDHTIITIGRQYGSGGKEIAELVAKKMGVRCYDRQVLYLAAEKMGDSDLDIEAVLDSAYQTPETRMGGFGVSAFDTVPYYNKMYKEQAKAILQIAGRESAVFLGRCADAVLQEVPNHYSFFIYAGEEYRRERAKEYYDNQSLKELEKEEKIRERYYNYYTGRKWGDPQNYDLMIDAGKVSAEEGADLILWYVEHRQKESKV